MRGVAHAAPRQEHRGAIHSRRTSRRRLRPRGCMHGRLQPRPRQCCDDVLLQAVVARLFPLEFPLYILCWGPLRLFFLVFLMFTVAVARECGREVWSQCLAK